MVIVRLILYKDHEKSDYFESVVKIAYGHLHILDHEVKTRVTSCEANEHFLESREVNQVTLISPRPYCPKVTKDTLSLVTLSYSMPYSIP